MEVWWYQKANNVLKKGQFSDAQQLPYLPYKYEVFLGDKPQCISIQRGHERKRSSTVV